MRVPHAHFRAIQMQSLAHQAGHGQSLDGPGVPGSAPRGCGRGEFTPCRRARTPPIRAQGCGGAARTATAPERLVEGQVLSVIVVDSDGVKTAAICRFVDRGIAGELALTAKPSPSMRGWRLEAQSALLSPTHLGKWGRFSPTACWPRWRWPNVTHFRVSSSYTRKWGRLSRCATRFVSGSDQVVSHAKRAPLRGRFYIQDLALHEPEPKVGVLGR
jgi:hypothetical protein